MKLYQIFAAFVVCYQSFTCLGMDQNEFLFGVGKKKLSFPEPERQKLINLCRLQLAHRNLDKVDAKTLELKKEIVNLQTNNLTLKAEGTVLLNRINTLEDETRDLQKKLAAIQENKTTLPIHIQTAAVSSGKLITRSRKDCDTVLTSRDKLNGLKILKSQYNVRETSVLLDKLKEEVDDTYKAKISYFDLKNHLLCKKINEKFRFIFCPCTQKLAIVNHNPEVPLPNDFVCSDNCSFYKAKKGSSSDSEVDTSTEAESESDTQEEHLEPIVLSKAAINIADYM